MATQARYTNNIGPINQGTDNTDRIRTNQYLTPVYAATIALTTNVSFTLVQPAVLTGAVTFTIGVGSATTAPYVGDTITFLLLSDTTSRTATFGTGFVATATVAVAISKKANITFMFDGAAWQETGRSIGV